MQGYLTDQRLGSKREMSVGEVDRVEWELLAHSLQRDQADYNPGQSNKDISTAKMPSMIANINTLQKSLLYILMTTRTDRHIRLNQNSNTVLGVML